MKIEGTLAGVRPEPPSPSGATVGATIALSASLTFAALFVVCPLLWQVMPITTLPAPFPDTHQDAEWVTFFLVFALLLPLAVVASLRLADRIAAGPNGDSFGAVAAVLAAGAGLVVIVTRMSTSPAVGQRPAGPRVFRCALVGRGHHRAPTRRIGSRVALGGGARSA